MFGTRLFQLQLETRLCQLQLCSCCGQDLNSSDPLTLKTCLMLKAGCNVYKICIACLRTVENPGERNYRRRWLRRYKRAGGLPRRLIDILGASGLIFHGETLMKVIK